MSSIGRGFDRESSSIYPLRGVAASYSIRAISRELYRGHYQSLYNGHLKTLTFQVQAVS